MAEAGAAGVELRVAGARKRDAGRGIDRHAQRDQRQDQGQPADDGEDDTNTPG